MLFSLIIKQVSSAYSLELQLIAFEKLLTYIM